MGQRIGQAYIRLHGARIAATGSLSYKGARGRLTARTSMISHDQTRCAWIHALSKETVMKLHRNLAFAATLFSALSLVGCGSMSARDRDTAIGAAVGGVAGSVLTDGSTAGTIGGAAVGGVIGNQVGKDKK